MEVNRKVAGIEKQPPQRIHLHLQVMRADSGKSTGSSALSKYESIDSDINQKMYLNFFSVTGVYIQYELSAHIQTQNQLIPCCNLS